jgi:hypothetical protein
LKEATMIGGDHDCSQSEVFGRDSQYAQALQEGLVIGV